MAEGANPDIVGVQVGKAGFDGFGRQGYYICALRLLHRNACHAVRDHVLPAQDQIAVFAVANVRLRAEMRLHIAEEINAE